MKKSYYLVLNLKTMFGQWDNCCIDEGNNDDKEIFFRFDTREEALVKAEEWASRYTSHEYIVCKVVNSVKVMRPVEITSYE